MRCLRHSLAGLITVSHELVETGLLEVRGGFVGSSISRRTARAMAHERGAGGGPKVYGIMPICERDGEKWRRSGASVVTALGSEARTA